VTVVQNTTSSPGGPHANRFVYVTLIAGANGAPGYTSSGTVVGTYTVETDATGRWSIDLPPNSGFTPANSYYQVTEEGGVSLIVVPASGGPYNLSQLLVTTPPTPSAPGITGLQVAANGTVAGSRPEVNVVAGAGMTVTAVDDAANNRVDVTLSSTGSAPVTSVNTKTGAVVLAASDVGAVPTSAEGAANGVATLDASGHLTGSQGANFLTAANIGAAGAGAGIALASTDATTTNARTPTAHASTHATGGGDVLTPAAIGAIAASAAGAANGVATLDASGHLTGSQGASYLTAANIGAAGAGASIALASTDATTTNARTPTAHAASHAAGGSDQVTPDAIGAVSAYWTDMLGLGMLTAPLTDCGFTVSQTAGNLVCFLCTPPKTKTVSTLGIQVTAAGVTGSGVNALALYTEAGVLIDQTGDLTAAFSAIGFAEGAMGASHQLVAGTNYYICVLTHFSGTAPKFAATGTASSANIPVINGHYPAIFKAAQAAFPASFTPSSFSLNSGHYIAYAR
jgi:hypothetical protein